ncbi:YdcA family protein [Comamonas suwonensis]|uniref:YdcA family protein n=1 Tax=Comamonas suwonensis TaxID=2606214 RepID=UPI001F2DAD33|nr:hypothetical protein [Comamonas suwonensis]
MYITNQCTDEMAAALEEKEYSGEGVISKTIAACALLILVASSFNAYSANYPCSGKKGGVAHCAGEQFVCNDGSISGSKRSCSAEMGGGASRALSLMSQPKPSPSASGDCSCRSGNICTGPRGGQYCYSDSGRKSYVRR